MTTDDLIDYILAWLKNECPEKTAVLKRNGREALKNGIGDAALSDGDILLALKELREKGYIIDLYPGLPGNPGQLHYKITPEGERFISSGGYQAIKNAKLQAEEDAQNLRQLTKSSIETNQSVRETNASVIETNKSMQTVNQSVLDTNASIKALNEKTKNIYWFQKWTTGAAIIVSAASLVVALVALCNDDPKTEVKVVPVPTDIYYKIHTTDSTH